MHNERQLALARRLDMNAERRFLFRARAHIIMKIEPGLADADNLRLRRHSLEQIFSREFILLRHMVRMNTNRTPNIRIFIHQCRYLLEFAQARADRLHGTDPGLCRARQNAVEILGEIFKIEVAMAIDQHAVTNNNSDISRVLLFRCQSKAPLHRIN